MANHREKMVTLYDIKQGLDANAFILLYQPVVSFVTGELIGFEALLRWARYNSPANELQLILPDQFLPLAEQTGFISCITDYVLNRVALDYKLFSAAGMSPHIAVNVSAHDFVDDRLSIKLQTLKVQHQIDPKKIYIELSESASLTILQHSSAALHKLLQLGVGLTLDDVGSHFSTLDQLSGLPIFTLKISRTIVGQLLQDETVRTTIASILRTAQRMSARTVAKGVESEAVYRKLMLAGCKQGQGFWMAKPMILSEAIQFAQQGKKFPCNPISMIHQAQLDHMQWRKDVIEMFYFAAHSADEREIYLKQITHLIASHKECLFGMWYYEEGRQYCAFHEFSAIETHHVRFHALCNELLLSAMGGEPFLSEHYRSMLARMNEASSTIIQLLFRLEDHLHAHP